MLFGMMETAERVATVIPVTAVSRVGEHDVLILIIAYPLATAFRPSEFSGLTAKSTLSLSF
jgi:hypothetical protein